MKKCLLSFFYATLLLLNSCAKKKCCDFPVYKDFILADKNGAAWNIPPSNSAIKQDTFIVSGSNIIAGTEERFGFKIRFDGLGYYELKSNEAYYTFVKNNLTVSSYKLSLTQGSTIAVFGANEKDKIIQGFFELHFTRMTGAGGPGQPDSIRFLNGKFKVRLQN
ncbi:hypothetical protein [Mucilaginibacter sp. OK283]|uniref:hypothetical protein n=1 Tax=Mucilaginibacter sp. OK283 TaxID=1881049 RepID=UPI0008BDC411|nr:hypothetical protein [Mucilaginibacter sp. OK283]SEO25037.1 hypothetical protein SAMN05428947_101892 [Mucilaginibacter sp. OK283]